MFIIFSFLFFTGLVGFITWRMTRKDDHTDSGVFFLAGRSLTFPFIAGSLLLTNLSTEQMVGLNGQAFTDGLCVMAWEVLAVVALVAMALFFLPKFLRSGIATVPQFLEIRFNSQTRDITGMIFLIAYAVILLPIILYTGATGLVGILDIKGLLGIESHTVALWLIVVMVGVIGSVYALFGGLKTVAVSDTLNGIGLLTGGLLIVYFGLQLVGDGQGVVQGVQNMVEAEPEKFNSIGGTGQSVPFMTLFTGVMLLNMFYWCTNQQIIQRTFGASSLSEGQKGVLLTGFFKLLGPLYLVIPGLIAYYLFQKGIIDIGLKADGSQNVDAAYGLLVNKVLPVPLIGFFAAVMVGAILSSFNSALNSTCTLFSLGVYKNFINRQADGKSVVRSSKVFGAIIACTSMAIAPFLAQTDSIFGYLQKMNGMYFIPIFAVVLVGMLSKRVPSMAANIALVLGCSIIALGYFVPPLAKIVDSMNEFHFLGAVFVFLIAMMLVIGAIKPRETAFVQEDAKAVDMTPWKLAMPAGIALLVIVIIIYASFADFSILSG
jgi:solute:Na+ symporter, SSS family